MAGRPVQAPRFSMVPRNDVPRSSFDVYHCHKTTFSAGYLVPVYVEEVLPGDSIRVKMHALARLSTPLVPVMDNMWLESFFFYCPNRLVWDNWVKFMGEQSSPSDSTSYLVPQREILPADLAPGLLADYFGITMNNGVGDVYVNALPFRMYQLIWNEWFRDENLQATVVVPTGDGPDMSAVSPAAMLLRGKRHDYFTTCLPWPAKPTKTRSLGSMDPFGPGLNYWRSGLTGAAAPVSGIVLRTEAVRATGAITGTESGFRAYTDTGDAPGFYSFAAASTLVARAEPHAGPAVSPGPFPDIRVMVNDIRTAVMVQQFMERNARGGNRYTELMRSHFGVQSPDARLQRPEYLGGGRTPVTVNPVAQTSATGEVGTTTVLAELSGIGQAVASGHGFSQSFTEHGFIIGMVNVRADLTYQNGVERMWFRRTMFDYYFPATAHLGEQAVLQQEIYCNGNSAQTEDLAVFGYQERWAEYRTKPSRISGAFRSTAAQPLDMWHLAQNFAGRPTLGHSFIIEFPPMERVLQVDTNFGEQFLFDSVFDIRLTRALPMYSVPGMGGRL